MMAVMAVSTLAAKTRDEIAFFARVVCDKEQLVQGDSCVVSYVIYSTVPPQQVACKDALKLKNARVRPVRFNREATLCRVREGGRVLYRMVWAQYVVCPSRKGKYKLTPFSFKANFTYYQSSDNPGAGFFYRTPKAVHAKGKATTGKQSLQVTEPPLRSTLEILQSGENVF